MEAKHSTLFSWCHLLRSFSAYKLQQKHEDFKHQVGRAKHCQVTPSACYTRTTVRSSKAPEKLPKDLSFDQQCSGRDSELRGYG